ISYAGKDGSFTDQWRADVMPAQDHHLFQFVFILKTICTFQPFLWDLFGITRPQQEGNCEEPDKSLKISAFHAYV
ncbi:MAG: hypothetical protein IK103_06790, partial [Bacteroidales bacterium]|nr:hypothetical protein [Bacteroidales bacterium]